MSESNGIQYGGLTNPDFHDGDIYGVVMDGGVLTLLLRTEPGERYELRIPGVVRLNVMDFLTGNIVLDVEFYRGEDCPPELVHFAHWAEGTKIGPAQQQQQYDDFVASGHSLVAVTPSYGCHLAAIFSEPLDHVELKRL